MAETQVSLIMPVFNRAYLLPQVCSAMVNQEYPGIEYIAVDDGSSDGSAEILAGYPQIRSLRIANRGPSGARNEGLKIASGRIVHFIDSDVICPPDLVRIHMDIHRKFPRRIVQGQLVRILDIHDAGKLGMKRHNYSRSYFDTANVSVPRDEVEAVGGFDDQTFRKGWEDLDLGLRLRRRDLRVIRLKRKGFVWHHEGVFSEQMVADFFNDRYREGWTAVDFYRKHGGLSVKLMTQCGRLFLWYGGIRWKSSYLKSKDYFALLETLYRNGEKERLILNLRRAGYFFYWSGIRERVKEDGFLR